MSACYQALKRLAELEPRLYRGEVGFSMQAEMLERVISDAVAHLVGNEWRQAFNFLVQGVDRGNKEGRWQLSTPAPVQVVRHERNLITPSIFRTLPHTRRLQEYADKILGYSFHKSRLYVPAQQDASLLTESRTGEILLSAMVRGGLCSKTYLIALIEALSPKERRFHLSENYFWVDLRVKDTMGRDRLCRWFSDPVTELLIYRWHREGHDWPILSSKNPAATILSCIKSFLREGGFEVTAEMPRTLSKLCEQMSMLVRVAMPGYLVADALDKGSFSPLPAHVWCRIRTGNRCARPTGERTGEAPSSLDLGQVEVQVVDAGLRDQRKAVKNMIALMYQQRGRKRVSRTQILHDLDNWLEVNRTDLTVASQLLCLWAIALVKHGTRYKKQLAVTTARTYVSQAKGVVAVAGGRNLLSMVTEEMSELYRAVLDNAPSSKARDYAAGRLDEFHAFLAAGSDLGRINIHDLVESAAIVRSADANFITEEEYRCCHLELERRAGGIVSAQQILLILGYRLGLRRTEAWTLRLSQLQGRTDPELLVLSDSLKTLKSESARRRLPLRELVPATELGLLLDWHRRRQADQGLRWMDPSDSLWFPSEADPKRPIGEREIFDPLQSVMRGVTGDDEIRFHHLRHSMASTALVRLQSYNYPELRQRFSSFMDTSWWPKHQQEVGRDHLYQLALLLGHHSPDVSIASYCHMNDLISYELTRCADYRISIGSLASLVGARVVAFKRRYNRSDDIRPLDTALTLQRRKYAGSFPDPLNSRKPVSVSSTLEQNFGWVDDATQTGPKEPSIHVLHKMLVALCDGEPLDRVARRFRHSQKRLAEWLHAAQRLYPGSKSVESDLALSLLPTKPFKSSDVRDADLVLRKLQALRVEGTPELVRWALAYVIQYKRPSHAHLWFGTADDAAKFLDFLGLVGIPKTKLVIELRLPEGAFGARTVWERSLRLDRKSISEGEALKRSTSQEGAGYLRVLNEKPKPNGTHRASYGFFYALFMTQILVESEIKGC